jgi:hyperosmotically inducible periplasmic protein
MTLKEPRFALALFLFIGMACWLAADVRSQETTSSGSGESGDRSATSTGATTFSSMGSAPTGSAPTGSPPSGSPPSGLSSTPTPSTTLTTSGTVVMPAPTLQNTLSSSGAVPTDNSVVTLTDNDAIGNSAFRATSNPVAGVNRSTVLDTGAPDTVTASQDTQIRTSAMETLTSDGSFASTPITADSNGGVLRLTGTVNSREEKQRAEELAARTPGVLRVDNDLIVETDGDTIQNVLVS